MDDTKKYQAITSGRSSILKGAKFMRGFILRPEQILALFHDTQQGWPIPGDAQHQGIGLNDAGIDSRIQFYFTSVIAPHIHCFEMPPQEFFTKLKELSDGLIPADGELDGIEISRRFTVIMLRIKSSHWPPVEKIQDILPMVHLRYDLGRLHLVDVSKVTNNEKLIRIN